jgi:hypothetical protein
MIRFRVMLAHSRKCRIDRLLRELEGYEAAMRDRCSQLIELCDYGDAIHVEARRVLKALDS